MLLIINFFIMLQKINIPWLGELEIIYDDFPFDPMESWEVMMDICPNRNYIFPKSFSLDWEDIKLYNNLDSIKRFEKMYHICWLDCYQHSWISLSLAWEWMQCRFDTTKNIWVIWLHRETYTKEEAIEYMRSFLRKYNAYLNWEFYCFEYDGVTYGNLYDRNDIITTIEWLITGDITNEQRSVLNSITG